MRTYLDSGVLLTGWKGKLADSALNIMEDKQRRFFSSYMVRLELTPKPLYEKRKPEVEFYEAFWESLEAEEPLTATLAEEAFNLAKKYGLAAVDAIHVAAAIREGVEEFITSELPGKPLFRVTELKVITLQSLKAS